MPSKGLNRYFKQVKHTRKGFLPPPVCGSVTQHCLARMTAITRCWQQLRGGLSGTTRSPYTARSDVTHLGQFIDSTGSMMLPDEVASSVWIISE
jgi:hypothetical protein